MTARKRAHKAKQHAARKAKQRLKPRGASGAQPKKRSKPIEVDPLVDALVTGLVSAGIGKLFDP
jgi:hypothetical protein